MKENKKKKEEKIENTYRTGNNEFYRNDRPGHFIWNYRIEPKERSRRRERGRIENDLPCDFILIRVTTSLGHESKASL